MKEDYIIIKIITIIIIIEENIAYNGRLCERVSQISDRGPAIFSGAIKEQKTKYPK
jgi:hypothetical protein